MKNPAKKLLSMLGIINEKTECYDGVIHGAFQEEKPEDDLVYRFIVMPWSERYQDFRKYREALRQIARIIKLGGVFPAGAVLINGSMEMSDTQAKWYDRMQEKGYDLSRSVAFL